MVPCLLIPLSLVHVAANALVRIKKKENTSTTLFILTRSSSAMNALRIALLSLSLAGASWALFIVLAAGCQLLLHFCASFKIIEVDTVDGLAGRASLKVLALLGRPLWHASRYFADLKGDPDSLGLIKDRVQMGVVGVYAASSIGLMLGLAFRDPKRLGMALILAFLGAFVHLLLGSIATFDCFSSDSASASLSAPSSDSFDLDDEEKTSKAHGTGGHVLGSADPKSSLADRQALLATAKRKRSLGSLKSKAKLLNTAQTTLGLAGSSVDILFALLITLFYGTLFALALIARRRALLAASCETDEERSTSISNGPDDDDDGSDCEDPRPRRQSSSGAIVFATKNDADNEAFMVSDKAAALVLPKAPPNPAHWTDYDDDEEAEVMPRPSTATRPQPSPPSSASALSIGGAGRRASISDESDQLGHGEGDTGVGLYPPSLFQRRPSSAEKARAPGELFGESELLPEEQQSSTGAVIMGEGRPSEGARKDTATRSILPKDHPFDDESAIQSTLEVDATGLCGTESVEEPTTTNREDTEGPPPSPPGGQEGEDRRDAALLQ